MKSLRQLRRKVLDIIIRNYSKLWLIIIIILPFVFGVGLYIKSTSLLNDQLLNNLLFSSDWKPMSHKFGFLPFIISSLWVSLLALALAGPICVFSAIHLSIYAPKKFLKFMQPVIDILAGIPSVIYGVWGILAIVPFIKDTLGPFIGIETYGYSILAGAIVLAVMIIPFILNICIEVFESIPIQLQEASLSLGASRWYTVKYVLIKRAFPGIISAIGLGLSRAFGETMAVLMVVGNVTAFPKSIFEPGYPLPALIANNYGEMLSIPLYDSALMFAAFLLLIVVLFFNVLSRLLIIRYEKIYK